MSPFRAAPPPTSRSRAWTTCTVRFAGATARPVGGTQRLDLHRDLRVATSRSSASRTSPFPGIAFRGTIRQVQGRHRRSLLEHRYKPIETCLHRRAVLPFWTMRTFATWEIFRPLRAYTGFDWDNDHWFRTGRGDKNDKIYYYEKRATIGASIRPAARRHRSLRWLRVRSVLLRGRGLLGPHDNRVDVDTARSSSAGCTSASEPAQSPGTASAGARASRQDRSRAASRRLPA